MSNYLLEVVKSELTFLSEEWDQDITVDSLRRSSNVLRMLLVDQNLLKAWRDVEYAGQPMIVAPTLEKRLSMTPLDSIIFATAGGARFKGQEIRNFFIRKGAATPEEIKKIAALDLGGTVASYRLTDFVESTCMIVKGLIVSREELVKYVANKLGGTHIDTTRDLTKPLEQKYSYLDSIRETTKVADKNAIYYELLSVGQSLVKSEDIQRLREKLNDVARL